MEHANVSIHFLRLILMNGGEYTSDGLSDLYEIENGNKKVILEHLKAIYSIIGQGIQEIEKN